MNLDLEAYAQRIAQKNHWVLTSDSSFKQSILEGLATNLERHGKLFCPCREVPPADQQDLHSYLCPCAVAVTDIAEWGQCYCGLYLSSEKDPDTVTSIPDRFLE